MIKFNEVEKNDVQNQDRVLKLQRIESYNPGNKQKVKNEKLIRIKRSVSHETGVVLAKNIIPNSNSNSNSNSN